MQALFIAIMIVDLIGSANARTCSVDVDDALSYPMGGYKPMFSVSFNRTIMQPNFVYNKIRYHAGERECQTFDDPYGTLALNTTDYLPYMLATLTPRAEHGMSTCITTNAVLMDPMFYNDVWYPLQVRFSNEYPGLLAIQGCEYSNTKHRAGLPVPLGCYYIVLDQQSTRSVGLTTILSGDLMASVYIPMPSYQHLDMIPPWLTCSSWMADSCYAIFMCIALASSMLVPVCMLIGMAFNKK